MRKLYVITVFAALVFASGCRTGDAAREFPVGEIREGDLAFRCGRGVFSRAVLAADSKGEYSHVGIVVKEGGAWKVVHAVPGEREGKADFDRVKMEPLDVFYSNKRAFRGCLVHTGLTADSLAGSLCSTAIQFARDSVRFDNSYTLSDSSEVYCTEFVWRLYRRVGTDLTEGRRRSVNILGIDGPVILPEHILDYSGNTMYFSF